MTISPFISNSISKTSTIHGFFAKHISIFENIIASKELPEIDDQGFFDQPFFILVGSDRSTGPEELSVMRDLLDRQLDRHIEALPNKPLHPHGMLLNIWLLNDPALEAKWEQLVGDHVARYQAETFYMWVMNQVTVEHHPDFTIADVPMLHTFFEKPLPERILKKVLPSLSGIHHHDLELAGILDIDMLGIQGWNLYLDHINTLYGLENPFLAFEQWHALSTHGAHGVEGSPWHVFFYYAVTTTDPGSWWRIMHADDDPKNDNMRIMISSMYGWISDTYIGEDMHRMEAAMALAGYPPPIDHPRFDALLGLLQYSTKVCPCVAPWHMDPTIFHRPDNAMLHSWVHTMLGLGRDLQFRDYLEYYIDAMARMPILELDIADPHVP